MIDQDRERFARIFTDMLITLSPREEHRVGVKAYFDALNHADPLPIEVIEQAGRQIQSRAGQKWFPTSGEWKELALQLDRTAEIANSAASFQIRYWPQNVFALSTGYKEEPNEPAISEA